MKQLSMSKQGSLAVLGARLQIKEIRSSLESSISKITHYHNIIALEEQRVRELLSKENDLLSLMHLEEE